MTEIQKERVRSLVRALRSGAWSQTKGQLGIPNTNKRCCLGVACELAVKAGVIPEPRAARDYLFYGLVYDGRNGDLPAIVRDWFGFNSSNPTYGGLQGLHSRSLAGDNDNLMNFEQIAEIIEREFLNAE